MDFLKDVLCISSLRKHKKGLIWQTQTNVVGAEPEPQVILSFTSVFLLCAAVSGRKLCDSRQRWWQLLFWVSLGYGDSGSEPQWASALDNFHVLRISVVRNHM